MKTLTVQIDITAHGSGNIIARMANVTPSAISQIRSGKKKPSPRLAKKLEKITGIPFEVWIFPGDYSNPFLKRKEKKKC